MGYGKHFSSMYTGSMHGAGAIVFAVWGYCISNNIKGSIEINPKHLAPILGESIEDIKRALKVLTSPDPDSRCQKYDGKRLLQEGQYQYFMPTADEYRKMKDDDEKREYNRKKKREQRERDKQKAALQAENNDSSTKSNNVNENQKKSTQTRNKKQETISKKQETTTQQTTDKNDVVAVFNLIKNLFNDENTFDKFAALCKYDQDIMEKYYNQAINNPDIKNPVAWLLSAAKEKYQLPEKPEEKTCSVDGCNRKMHKYSKIGNNEYCLCSEHYEIYEPMKINGYTLQNFVDKLNKKE